MPRRGITCLPFGQIILLDCFAYALCFRQPGLSRNDGAAPMKTYKITAPSWLLEPALQKLLNIFNKTQLPYRFVGGCVRESLAGRNIHDIDLATTYTPEEVQETLKEHAVKIVPTGLKHGTLTLVVDHHPFEITTLRQDVDHDGRWAKIIYTTDWALDATRRDFTINAFSMCDNTVYDYVGGMADLKARRVRFIGDPLARIHEDYLRILRYFRFLCDYHGAQHRASLKACLELKTGLATLSGERLFAELMRIMKKKDPLKVVRLMTKHKLVDPVFQNIPVGLSARYFEKLLAVESDFEGQGNQALRRLYAYLNPKSKIAATAIADRLRMSRVDKNSFVTWQEALSSRRAADLVVYHYLDQEGADFGLDFLALAKAKKPGLAVRKYLKLIDSGAMNHFPLTSKDFPHLQGEALGKALKAARKKWVESGFTLTQKELL